MKTSAKGRRSLLHLTAAGLMTAVITVCSWISIPAPIPFSLQTLAIFLALLLLGGRLGLLSVCAYILLGAIGLPVFSGFKGGISVILGPTGGYLIGFVIMSALYAVITSCINDNKTISIIALSVGLLICYFIAALWYMLIYLHGQSDVGFAAIMTTCVAPFVIPDILKLLLAVIISDRAKPQLKQIILQ